MRRQTQRPLLAFPQTQQDLRGHPATSDRRGFLIVAVISARTLISLLRLPHDIGDSLGGEKCGR
ncbi:hypothetical protein MHY1_00627 [Methylovirgula sp. HY1]|nr:hypothetical protein MHY1_00627 [Methylovirgula sp. HY1]